MLVRLEIICLLLTTILGCIRVTLQLLHSGLGSEDEIRLVEDLFKKQGYNPLIRPVKNLSDNVTVKLGLAISQVINVDEKNQIMKSNVWLRMLWNDFQLQWDPADYGNIPSIRVLPEKVWRPDIVLFNNADGKYEATYSPNCVLYNDGTVLWIPPAIYKSSCTIDVEYFPFDEQKCDMKFGSWTFNSDQVMLGWYEGKKQVDLTDYVNSGTWDIVDNPAELTHTDQNKKTMITFTLKIRRKTLFYTVNLIIPCVLISFLSVGVFYVPADAGEKVTMVISILLSMVVFLLLVSKILPPTSETIPLIAKYLLFTFIMNIFTIVITVIIINWNFRNPRTHNMPNWVRVVFLKWLPTILFVKRPNHGDRWLKKIQNRKISYPSSNYDPKAFKVNANTELLELSDMHHPNCKMNRKPSRTDGEGLNGRQDEYHQSVSPEAHKAAEAVSFISQHLKLEDEYNDVIEDWTYIALVIDRLLLLTFLCITIGGTVGILCKAPHIFEYIDQDTVKQQLSGGG
ncbi:unnamed protein product [Owenia fusiformis]|uniref:Uncharacterized protein n=1 Tax=Owenia fusiformis TaxID=6347 RepID=A0A8J1TZ79_OWEFU|nr:unnamed protein product [Owenia fusiformis]